MVIGPTPPGTGVIAPATSLAEAKSTSPTNRVLPGSAPATRLIPTSITVAPGLSQAPVTISARPTAAITMSARRTTSARSLVRLWAMVTVQFSARSSCATGLPTSTERPITTASLPERSPSNSLASIRQPSGVQGTRPGKPEASRPALIGVSPSTSLSGSMLSITAFSSSPPGSGNWTRMPSTAGSALSASTSAMRSACAVSAGSLCSKLAIPASSVALPLERT